jgi:hypothetical protein
MLSCIALRSLGYCDQPPLICFGVCGRKATTKQKLLDTWYPRMIPLACSRVEGTSVHVTRAAVPLYASPLTSVTAARGTAINIVRKSRRKHFWIVSLMICFPSWLDKVTIVLHCRVSRMWCYFSIFSRPLIWCARGTDMRHYEANLWCYVFVSTSEWQAVKKCWNTRLLPLSAV